MRPERGRADRHTDLRAGVEHFRAAHEPVGRVHGDRAHDILAQMLRHFEHEAASLDLGFQRGQDFRQIGFELHVDDRADDLVDAADIVSGGGGHNAVPYYPELIK